MKHNKVNHTLLTTPDILNVTYLDTQGNPALKGYLMETEAGVWNVYDTKEQAHCAFLAASQLSVS